MNAAYPVPWSSFPAEMKLSVVDHLHLDDVKSLSTVDHETYPLCVPSIFRSVNISSYEALQTYLSTVPHSYYPYIRRLHICTKVAETGTDHRRHVTFAVLKLLQRCTQVEKLTLDLEGSLSKAVIPCFATLRCLTNLCINHCGDEQRSPISERLVVAIAASIPNLSQLSLDRITRSVVHAPELYGVPPFIPLVHGDGDIPDHPILGSELRLPSLLRLSKLRKLRIRDTHLGDPQWVSTPLLPRHSDYNRLYTERIMGNIGHTVDEFALNTSLTSQTFDFAKHDEPPLKRLRKIHLTPLFPVENVVDTLSTLSGSPIEQLSVQCHEDDVVDMCSALEDFLSMRAERGEKSFYQYLSQITVKTVSDLNDAGVGPFATHTMNHSNGVVVAEHADAVKRLQEYFRDLRLSDGTASVEDFCDSSALTGLSADEKHARVQTLVGMEA
ncbi:hypothetical protein B0H21DRAFT_841007 [Amylocystis lapponica]|nr:hypothetical protein B0H21DRAFT_841007 [Amylocystis lapponica]